MLKANGTLDAELKKITAELGTGQDKLGKLISEATPNQTGGLDFSASYTKFKDAVTEATKLIDETLESNDLTELDTTNLKALRSYINETKATFDAAVKESGLKSDGANLQATVTKEALEKLKAGLDSATELGKTATEKAAATHAFSQQQPETVAEIRNDAESVAHRLK